ncbi:threonine aldolase family protein [Sphingobacterium sp. SYP-B4668]|uniref:threonine aldolase family protein n=1 Tax=Sphingobacterium sp. SYP-B4668 TaxID=2996035 RepID=UPI0022DE32AC|nr:aminotransferase class I/II-fold pyridoxal phosphate-dependent enzyme [Sphingobacterium sp. SYP-B4668]
MYSFKNDYSEGAHPNILKALVDKNLEQQIGYGEDIYCSLAKDLLRQKMNHSAAAVFFVSGGTQANLLVIASLLRTHEAVISAKTGHIYANETGAIEATGHRVIPVETRDGKLLPSDIELVLQQYAMRPHVVKPKMVYISNSTEIGTLYRKEDLEQLSAYCNSRELYLFLDGARLGHALTAEGNNLTLSDVSRLTDVFYIGGTKNGALMGEAIVFNKPDLASEFDYILKQRGALLAKGRLLGIQFVELFKDDLYFSLARRANEMATKIGSAIKANGYPFLTPSTTNQIFPILPKAYIDILSQKYDFFVWKVVDEHQSAIRLITSWATEESQVDEFIKDLNNL